MSPKEKPLNKPFKYTGKGKYKFSVYVKTNEGKIKKINFGHKDYKDFRQHADKERRRRYLLRAKGIKNKKGQLTYKLKTSANYWSVKYLWKG